MGCTVAELGERMSGQEFGLHWADYRRHPWGPEGDEVYAAMIAATIARWAGRCSEHPDKIQIEDFLTFRRPPPVEMDPAAFARQVIAAQDFASG